MNNKRLAGRSAIPPLCPTIGAPADPASEHLQRQRKKRSGGALNRRLYCKGIAETHALKALPQDLDLAPLRCVEQHDIAFHKPVVEQFLGVLAWDIRYEAGTFENLFERRALAAGHLNGWHGT
jgi:hypothetical protein